MIRMEYTGKIPELQGKTALVRSLTVKESTNLVGPISKYVMAQFDDIELTFNGNRMGYGWSIFSAQDFSPISQKLIF